MKVLFVEDVLLDVIRAKERNNDTLFLLNCCEDHLISGYVSTYSLIMILKQFDYPTDDHILKIMSNLLEIIEIKTKDIRKATQDEYFWKGFYSCLMSRYGFDYIVSRHKIGFNHSKIELIDPKELRKLIENGKTDKQRRNL